MRNHLIRLFCIKGLLKYKPGEDLSEKVMVNTAIMITLASFLFMISGCSYYRAVPRVNDGSGHLITETINKFYPEYDYPRDQYPISNLQKMFFLEYNVYAVDSTGSWQLTDAEIINDTIYALATSSPAPPDSVADIPADGVSVRYHPKEERDLLKRVFIYVDYIEYTQEGKAYFSVKDISKIITFKDHPAAKVGFTILILGGILTITFVILILMALDEGINYSS
jgi:hypothetical protein